MNDSGKVRFRQVCLWILVFAGVGAVLGVGALIVAIAFTGYSSVFGPAILVSYLALWPYVVLHLMVPEDLLRLFFARFPFAYLPGLPMLGWALFGIPVGLWRGSRKLKPAKRLEGNTGL